MKLSTLMEGKTKVEGFEGISTVDNFVLAINPNVDTGESVTPLGDYVVVQYGIAGMDASLEAETEDKTYIRSGKVTTKTATQRTFNPTGDRMIGDPFQDLAMSHDVKYGTGQSVIRDYVYFHILTGLGEKSKAAIIVNSDGSGDAGASAEIDIEVRATQTPVEFDYFTAVTENANIGV